MRYYYDMSGRQDLSHIAALRPRPELAKSPGSAAADERHARLARLLGAEMRSTARGQHMAVMCRFPFPGQCAVGPRSRQMLASHSSSEVADPNQWLFLDTETTGLAGGTGTYAFLVGVGWWEAESLIVEQLFMRDHSDEASLLLDLSRRLQEKRVLVTFNGKSFDWPLLETRYRMTRAASILQPSAHLDLLHPARQLWRFKLKSVALSEIERYVLQLERGPDIPSHTIPGRYFDFLRGGPEEPIVEVFRHNQLDLLGLATLAVRMTKLFEEPEAGDADAEEVFGISRMLQRRGEELLATRGYQQALNCGLPQEADRIARRELALLARRQGDFASANALWEALVGATADGMQAYEQLAIHYEHRVRDPQHALLVVREALVQLRAGHLAGRLGLSQYRRWHAAFRHRLGRLEALAGPRLTVDE